MSVQDPATVMPPDSSKSGSSVREVAGPPNEGEKVTPIRNVFPAGEDSAETGSALLPVSARPAGAWWAWHPLHGGTGLTTIAQAVRGGIELDGLPSAHGWPNLPVVVVCRSHHAGLTAAQRFAKAIADGEEKANVVGLVVVADAPRLHRQLSEHLRLVSGAYDRVWRIPWVRPWRLGQPVSIDNVPRNALDLLSDLADECNMPLNSNTEGDTTP